MLNTRTSFSKVYTRVPWTNLARLISGKTNLPTHFLENMKLYTDNHNLLSLRVYAASHLSQLDVEVVNVKDARSIKLKDGFRRHQLPILEVDAGKYLYNANSICRFLLSKTLGNKLLSMNRKSLVDEIIEWDSSHLQPAVFPALLFSLNSAKKMEHAHIEKHLQKLTAMLASTQGYLVSSEVSVADIVVWGTLCPVLTSTEFTLDDTVRKWFLTMQSLPACVQAIQKVSHPKDGFKSAKNSLESYIAFKRLTDQKSSSAPIQEKEGGKTKATQAAAPVAQETEGPTQEEIDQARDIWVKRRTKLSLPRERKHPILPQEGERNILITSALLYVNNVPHLGNIIGCVLSADVYSRFCRLRNHNVIYICGTDEYGTATETKAIEEGVTPQEICDKYHKIHTQIYKWFNIDFDYFGRTTTQQQTEITQDIFWHVYKEGNILEDTVEQLKCFSCDRFLADRFVEGVCPLCNYEDARGDQCDACGKLINATELKSPRCKICSSPPQVVQSQHLFLDLPKVEPQLRQFVDKALPTGKWTQNAQHITKGWLAEGLRPRCITRDLKWGTPVPLTGYENKVFYVWFDAPIGYLSITANYTKEWKKWWKNPDQVTLTQFMAKDNVPFHTIVFPSSMIGANDNYTLLDTISATEYLNYEDDKFSKSRGVGVFGDHAESTGIPADIYRFYLLYVRPESADSAFSWSDLVLKHNSELLNNLGNFVNRAAMFLKNSFNGVIPEMQLNDADYTFIASVNKELNNYIDSLEHIKIRNGLVSILSITRLGNQYMQTNKPWVLVKGSEEDKVRAGTIIGLSVNVACLTAVLMQPYMPDYSEQLQRQLNLPQDRFVVTSDFQEMLLNGHQIGDPYPLFKKLEESQAQEMKERFQGKRGDEKKANKQQQKPAASVEPATGVVDPALAQQLEQQVKDQGELVRKVKTDKAAKEIITAEVNKLLDLKKQLAVALGEDSHANAKGKNKAAAKPTSQTQQAKVAAAAQPKVVKDPILVAQLELQVKYQGDLVRQVKVDKAEKDIITSAVDKLLDLKRQLAIALGEDPDANAKGKKGKKK